MNRQQKNWLVLILVFSLILFLLNLVNNYTPVYGIAVYNMTFPGILLAITCRLLFWEGRGKKDETA